MKNYAEEMMYLGSYYRGYEDEVEFDMAYDNYIEDWIRTEEQLKRM